MSFIASYSWCDVFLLGYVLVGRTVLKSHRVCSPGANLEWAPSYQHFLLASQSDNGHENHRATSSACFLHCRIPSV